MTVELGGIVITADLETERLIIESKKIDKAMDDMGKSATKAEKGLKDLETQATKTAKAVKDQISGINGAKNALGGLVQTTVSGNASIGDFAQKISSLGFLFGPLAGTIATAAGVLLAEWLTGLEQSKDQVEKLKEAMADLDKVIKFSSDGVAALSNEYAFLAKSNKEVAQHMRQAAINKFEFEVRNAKDAITELIKEQSSFTSSLGSNGVASVAQMGIALKQLGINTNDYQEALKQSGKEGEQFAWHLDTIQQTTKMLADKFGLSREEAFRLGKAFAELGDSSTPEKINEFAQILTTFKSNTDSGKEAFHKLNQKFLDSASTILKITYLIAGLNAQLGNIRTVQQENVIEGMLKSAKTEAELLGKSVRERKIYLAKQAGMNGEELKEIDENLAKTEAFNKAEEARRKAELEEKKKANEASRKAKSEAKKAQREREQAAKKAAREAKQAAKKEIKALENAQDQVKQLANEYKMAIMEKQGMSREAAILETRLKVLSGVTEAHKKQVDAQKGAFYDAILAAEKYAGSMYDLSAMDDLNSLMMDFSPTLELDMDKSIQDKKIADGIQSYRNQITMIDQVMAQMQSKPLSIDSEKQLVELMAAKETYLSVIMSAEAMRTQLEEQYRQQRIEAQWEEWKQASEGAKMFGSAVEAMGANATSVITGLLNGTMSVREAFASIANTILTSVVQSLVEMGMAQVKQMVMGQAVAKSSMIAQMVKAKALAAAFAPAASMVSLATQGANAIPAQAAITSTMGIAQAAAVTGRKLGGPVSAKQMYRVGENNQPEIFKASNGMQYMIPGQSGRVLNNKESQGSKYGENKSVTVVINQANHFSSEDTNGNQAGIVKALQAQIKSVVSSELQSQMRAGGMLAR